MTVFKGYLQLINRNKSVGLIYLFVFIGITLLLQSIVADNPDVSSFEVSSINIAVIDKDRSVISEGLIDYLDVDNEVTVSDEITDEQVEMLYYEYLDYVLVIPEGYGEKALKGEAELNSTKGAYIASGIFADISVKSYTDEIYVLSQAGYGETQAVSLAEKICSVKPDVEIVNDSGNQRSLPGYYYFMRFVPFMYLGVLTFIVGTVMLEYRKEDVRRRLKCSAISTTKQGAYSLLAFAILALLIFVLTWLISIAIFGMRLINDSNFILYVLNALAILGTSVSIAFLLGVAVKSESALSGMANVVSLGLCFLGGVFVPIELLGEKMLTLARFLPTYWFENNLNILIWHADLVDKGGSPLSSYYTGVGVQFAITVVFIVIALVIRRMQSKAE